MNQRFLNAFTPNPPDRPPVWLMRQAGRYLPEYRALKERYDFLTLVKTPELATEVSLQPLQRFPQLDAAIVFSDILIVPEAMGQSYAFRETGGIEMAYPVRCKEQVVALQPEAIPEATAYLPAALKLLRPAIGAQRALLGFGGSPWTLATYMVEGGSSRDFNTIRSMAQDEPSLFHALMEKITEAVVRLFTAQIEAGVDAIQIFDSWASAVPDASYEDWSLQYIRRIVEELGTQCRFILFAKGRARNAAQLAATGVPALAIDHSVKLADVRHSLQNTAPQLVLQGNLDPVWMTREPDAASEEVRSILDSLHPWDHYIFNLGHGITPEARLDTVEAVLNTINEAATWKGPH